MCLIHTCKANVHLPNYHFYGINHPYGSSITVHQHDPHGHDVSGLLGFQGIEVRCQAGTTTWIDRVYAEFMMNSWERVVI
jgi:hypothetical protein